jgi:hypothetical protein
MLIRHHRADTGIEGASSRPVRRIVLVNTRPCPDIACEVLQRPEVVSSALSVRAERRGKPMTELLITVSALLLALIGCAVLNGQSRSGDTEAAVAEEQARRMQAIALSVF